MGFKKLREFNLALLAKQGWRLMVCPDSLVSRVLKAKYFPSTNFLEAALGNNPSYIWRSFLAGKEILREGMAKRLGDGNDTLIWGVPWLADKANPTLHTHVFEQLKEAKVAGLLSEAGTWDVDILRDIFEPDDIPRILATPVSPDFRDEWF
ncbi:PREDICTED: uncharacterized protein LOC109160522 [Ipomoea nil]|uniref:uncharacterized protein LOC109160522 n=1 Tax=Ipomoea nil TaxID=35883 RepID=UPI000901FB3E|nr:PREDICTED: uncharacterized protein LOC109160522 [Ipomoea nil]